MNYMSSSSRNWNARCLGLSHHTNDKFLQNHAFFLRMSLLCWLGHPKNNGWVNSYKGIKVRLKALGPNEKITTTNPHDDTNYLHIQTIKIMKLWEGWKQIQGFNYASNPHGLQWALLLHTIIAWQHNSQSIQSFIKC